MQQLASEGVLVADVDGESLAGDLHRSLIRRSRRLVGERNMQHAADEPAEERLQWNRFAERDQMVLAIALGGRSAYAHHAVEVMIFVFAGLPRLEEEESE